MIEEGFKPGQKRHHFQKLEFSLRGYLIMNETVKLLSYLRKGEFRKQKMKN